MAKSPDNIRLEDSLKNISTADSDHCSKAGSGPVVSVYTICYNQEKYIRQTLDGILLQQTDFPIEAIVVDDASTDSTPDIIREYAAKWPDIFRPVLLKENYYSSNRSKFLDIYLPMARGEFMAICEGDDYWTYPLKLQRQVEFLRRHPDYSACFHLYNLKNETEIKRSTPASRILRSRTCGVKEIIVEETVQTASIVARLDALKNDPELMQDLRESPRSVIDRRFYLSLLATGKVYVFKRRWSVYRLNKKGISYIDKRDDAFDKHIARFRWFSTKYGGRFADLPEQALAERKVHDEFYSALDKISDAFYSRKFRKGIGPLLRISFRMPKLTYVHAIAIYRNHHAKE